MPFVVEIEQELLDQSELQFSKELVRLRDGSQPDDSSRESVTKAGTRGLEARRRQIGMVYERWNPKTWRRMRVTVEDCKTAENCQLFLEEERENYRAFEHRRFGPRERQ